MRIDQTSGFLLDFVRQIAAGRVLPAAMQRPYVWRSTDVEAMCDSILSGFPIGGFLSWLPHKEFDLASVAKSRLGPVIANVGDDASTPHYLLLDGQNRLATVAWMMSREDQEPPSDPSEAEEQTWLCGQRLVLDFATKSVKFVPEAEADQGLRMPAWTLVASSAGGNHDANKLMRKRYDGPWRHQYAEAEVDSFLRLWDDSRDKFKDARTTHTIIENASPEEARHAFLRICKVGVPMSEADFDAAIGWGRTG